MDSMLSATVASGGSPQGEKDKRQQDEKVGRTVATEKKYHMLPGATVTFRIWVSQCKGSQATHSTLYVYLNGASGKFIK